MEKSPDGYGIECYHVNARFSKTLEDVGEFQGAKIFLILFYCLQAIWCRFRYGVTNFYYVPAPGKAVALYRDWLVMLICRPFFKNIILHWHAAGLAKWLETSVQIRTRAVTYRLFKPVDLSIVLSRVQCGRRGKTAVAASLRASATACRSLPGFCGNVLPRRRARFAARRKNFWPAELAAVDMESRRRSTVVKVFYLAHCMREKGLFDAWTAWRWPTQSCAAATRRSAAAHVAGEFVDPPRQGGIRRAHRTGRNARTDRRNILGFVCRRRTQAAGVCAKPNFCFPTYYHAESRPGI